MACLAWDMTLSFFSSFSERYQFVIPNAFIGNSRTELDIAAIRRSYFLDEIELKVSVSDFRADFKKRGKYGVKKHALLASGQMKPNYFSFLVPDTIAKTVEDELPEHSGLYVYRTEDTWRRISEVKSAPLLHRGKMTDKDIAHLGKKIMWRFWRQSINAHRERG